MGGGGTKFKLVGENYKTASTPVSPDRARLIKIGSGNPTLSNSPSKYEEKTSIAPMRANTISENI